MDEERCFVKSSLSTSSSVTQDPLTVNVIDSMGWYEYFLKRHGQFGDENNVDTLQSCRVLVLSGTDLRDTYEQDGEMNTVMSDEELENSDTFHRDKDNVRKLLEKC